MYLYSFCTNFCLMYFDVDLIYHSTGSMSGPHFWKRTILALLINLILTGSSNISDVRFVTMSAPSDVPSPRNVKCSHQKSSSMVCAIHCKEVGCLMLSVDGGNCSLCTLSPRGSTDVTLPGLVYFRDQKSFFGKFRRKKTTIISQEVIVHE